jgi:hypothetical protein
MPRVLLVLIALLPCACTVADSVMSLDDLETGAASWGRMTRVSEPVHGGKWALQWKVADAPVTDSPRFLADWRDFDELTFWAYLPAPVDYRIPLVFMAPGGYYLVDWKLDWSGWKQQHIRLADAKPAHTPAGWDQITSFGFRAQGYGQGPVPPDLILVFDDFALHSPKDLPVATLDEWMARERSARMAALKARGNPYFAAVLDSLQSVKAQPDLPKEVTSGWTFRGLGARLLPVAWAAVADESPRKGDATLIAHACAVVDFMLSEQKDGSWYYSRKWLDRSDPNCDRFALGPLMDAVGMLRATPEGKAAWSRWEAPLRQLVDFQYEKWWRYKANGYTDNIAWGSGACIYPNQDVFVLVIMARAHEFWGDERYRQATLGIRDALERALLPDGGMHYIGPETECDVYHTVNLLWIGRYYKLTGDEKAREMLARTVRYYPLSYSNEARPEYYTDCWWKHYWSDSTPYGPEVVAGVTGDGQNKWLADRAIERAGIGTDDSAVYAGMFYRSDVSARPLDDNWLVFDRNIGGPRGRFGDWYFAGVVGGGARDTFVGGMVSRPNRPQPLMGAFLAANVEVGVRTTGSRDSSCLYISGPDDRTSVAMAEDAAVLGARYTPRKAYINSVFAPQVPLTDWQGTQVWLLSRHGLVGLVELEATKEQAVPFLGGELRFGPNEGLAAEGDGFRCGALNARLLEHNFATVQVGPARPGYAQTSTTHAAVTLRTAGDTVTARPGVPVRYATVIAPDGAAAVSDYRRIEGGGVWGFGLRIGSRPYAALYNPGAEPAAVELPWAAESASVHSAQGAVATVPAVAGTLRLTVPAGVAVLVMEG